MKTISQESQGLYREKGSKFMAYLFPVNTWDECQDILVKLRSEHHKARHLCYACRLGEDADTEKSSDNGEPRNTAGLPILNQLISADLTNVFLVVVRYFGGTKLGKAGLIQAYKTAARNCIESASMTELVHKSRVKISFSPEKLGEVQRLVDRHSLLVENAKYGDDYVFILSSTMLDQTGLSELLEQIHGINNLPE